jgi:hypothetical protein
MKGLLCLLAEEGITNRNLRRAVALVSEIVRDDEGVKALALFISGTSPCLLPANFLGCVRKEVNSVHQMDGFREISGMALCGNFWDSGTPNVQGALNFSRLFGTSALLSGHEEKFSDIVLNGIDVFPSSSLKSLAKLCLSNVQQVRPKVIAEAFLKVVNQPLAPDIISNVIRCLAAVLCDLHSEDDVMQVLRSDCIRSRFKNRRYILLCSEIAKSLKSEDLSSQVIDHVVHDTTRKRRPLILNYISFCNIIAVCRDLSSLVPHCIDFLILDYPSSDKNLKNALENILNRILKIAKSSDRERDIIKEFETNLAPIPIVSPLKKFCLPLLIRYSRFTEFSLSFCSQIMDLLSDPQNRGFASRLVPPKIDALHALMRGAAERYGILDCLPLLWYAFRPILQAVGMAPALSCIRSMELSAFHRVWFTLECACASPKQMNVDELRAVFVYARGSGNWELRLRYFQAFVVCGFPHNEQDSTDFMRYLGSLLLNDTHGYQSSVIGLFRELWQTASDRTLAAFVCQETLKLVRVDAVDNWKGFGLQICEEIWKKYPELRTEVCSIEKRENSLGENVFEELFSGRFNDWRDESRAIELAAAQIQRCPDVGRLATVVFEKLLEARKPGLIGSTIGSVEEIFRRSKVTAVLTGRLLAVAERFDMGTMRRSAGIPYLALALIHASDEHFVTIANHVRCLSNLVKCSNSMANGLNIMRVLVLDTEITSEIEPYMSDFFKVTFHALTMFPSSWDVTAAVNLTFAAFVRKVLRALDFPNSITLRQFLNRIPSAKCVIMKALDGLNYHACFLALLLLSYFSNDCADPDLCERILVHLGSKNSRIRRSAARAAIAVIPLEKRQDICLSLLREFSSSTTNRRHGIIAFLQEAKFPYDADKFSLPILPAQNDSLHLRVRTTIVCDESLISVLKSVLLSGEFFRVSPALALDGLRYLAENCRTVESTYLRAIVSLIGSTQCVLLVASLITIFSRTEDAESTVESLTSVILSWCFEFRDEVTPILIAVSRLGRLLISMGWSVVFMLGISDYPAVRTRVAIAVSDGDIKSEREVIDVISQHLTTEDKMRIGVTWIKRIEERMKTDSWGEPLTAFVPEFYGPMFAFDGLETEFHEMCPSPKDLNEARTVLLSLAARHIPSDVHLIPRRDCLERT